MKTSSDFVLIRVYTLPQEAHMACSLLEAQGIRCVVTGEEVAGTLSYYGGALAKVELLVETEHAAQATELLDTAERLRMRSAGAWDPDVELQWRCATCGEANARTFDECWSCGSDRPQHPELTLPESDSQEGAALHSSEVTQSSHDHDDDSPYRTPSMDSRITRNVPPLEVERRAYRAAVLGVGLPVPLAFYAFRLCLECFGLGQSSRRLRFAFALSIVGILMALFWFVLFLLQAR
ncbi:MAG: DUF2007 domain-containing protein [Planctomycetaceae bacterium]